MVISASRRTDLPCYFSEWFYNRVREGFALVKNPMNPRQISRVSLSPEAVDCIVFWTKNPEPMMDRLGELEAYPYYFQFTLNGYGRDIEPGLPAAERLIETFQRLSMLLGRDRVVWRYDPILVGGAYTEPHHIRNFGRIADRLSGYTQRVVISFLDTYPRIKGRLKAAKAGEPEPERALALAGGLAGIAAGCGMEIMSCAEKLDLTAAGVGSASCIDKKLIERIAGCRLDLGRDKNQRPACGCFESIDIGAYDTCANGCIYCYANSGGERVRRRRENCRPQSPLLAGEPGPEDRITERKAASCRIDQMELFGESEL